MHFTCQIKVNNDMEFQYYKKIKILINKTIGLCNYMCFVTKWVKRRGFNNSIIISC
jgi:hypothetical protein